VTLRRDEDYWGADVPFMRGQANFDEIRLEFFGNATAWFEAFKAGEVDAFREPSAARWASQYDFPAAADGRVTLQEVPHGRPSGIDGFAMNTRRAVFEDWRVRQAMLEAFPFEFVNETLNDAEAPRITSYFANSELAMRPGPAEGRVAELLAPFEAELPPGTLEGYEMPVSDGTERNRAGLRRATALMEEAGYTVEEGVMTGPDGAPFTFEIVLESGETGHQAIVDIYVEALSRLGVRPTVSIVDPAQFTERETAYDYDMIHQRVGVSLSPGNEQYLYWGAEGVEAPGTRNLAGIDQPAVEAMIDAMVGSETREEFVAATRALDRVLTAGRYVVPLWQPADSRLATWGHLRHPDAIPVYGDWIGWLPNVWWSEEG
jgi:peptide/nickel transport system substrate-binding protein